MKIKDIRELSLAELDKKIRDSRDQLLQYRLKKQTGQLDKTHEITSLRRGIARMETARQQKASV